MRALRVSLIALALAFASAVGTAMATDLGDGIVTEDVPGWDGLYVGVYGGIWVFSPGYVYIGGVIGMNKTLDQGIVVGGEIQAGQNFYNGTIDQAEIQGVGRIGIAPADQVLLYLSGGVGYSYGLEVSVGGGAEFMVSDNMSLRADVSEYIWGPGPLDNNMRISLAALWHM